MFTNEPTKQNEYGTFAAIPWLQSLWDDLTGVTSQQREFEQQEYLMEKEMDYKNPVNQMAMMRQAGINPAVAAQGIAGAAGSGISAPSVSSSGNQGAAALTSLSSLLSAITQSPEKLANARETTQLLDYKQGLIKAQTIEALESAGLSHWNALSIGELLPTMKDNAKADFYMKLAEIKNISAEYQNIIAHHKEILQNIELSKSQVSELEARAALENEQKRYQQQIDDFFVSKGFHPDSPVDVSLRNSIVSGNIEQANAIGKGIEDYSYHSSYGEQSAVAEFAYRIQKGRADGQTASDIMYHRYGSMFDFLGRNLKEPLEAILPTVKDVSSDIRELLSAGDARGIRRELNKVLNECYEKLDTPVSEDTRKLLISQIDQINMVLLMSNNDLLDWAKKDNK